MNSDNRELVSKDFVFSRNDSDELIFKGDFEGLYNSEQDPWGQSGSDDRLKEYYEYSRKKLVFKISEIYQMMYSGKQISLLEIGCGHGHVAACLKESLPHEIKVTGMDISKTAVEKARLLYPENSFLVGDIKNTDQVFERYEVVIFSQILWYVIDCFPKVFENIGRLLKPNGCVVFVNAFIRDQQYGKEVVDGFDGLIRYVLDNYYDLYNVINAEIELSGKYLHDDGCMIIRKKN